MVDVPTAAPVVAVSVTVALVADSASVAGVNATLTPVGTLSAVNVIGPVNPPARAIVSGMVVVPTHGIVAALTDEVIVTDPAGAAGVSVESQADPISRTAATNAERKCMRETGQKRRTGRSARAPARRMPRTTVWDQSL
jgi:hypothetical protein